MHEARDRPGPSGLVARADARAGVPVEVFIEQGVIPPMRILLEFSRGPVHRPFPLLILQENAGQAARDLLRHFVEVHLLPGPGRAFDGE